MLRSLKPAPSHEDYFIQRYDWLMGWALKLTDHDAEQAEDLVHDAFIQFTLRRPDLSAIENTDAYLNRMLRNMHLSNVRRANLIKDLSLSIAAYDSAEIGLRRVDPRDQIKVQDDLRQICQYACARKESSKAGSTLILRFFHGYYPTEIARVLRCPQRPVYDFLKIARREARLYLENPTALKSITGNQTIRIPSFGQIDTTADLLGELRDAIFESGSGECFSARQLRNLYRNAGEEALDCAAAAHIASCPDCLDEVNRLLGLPLLSERFLAERLGRDARPPDDPGKQSGGQSGGRAIAPKKKQQRRLKEVIEHQPQELRILVNGFLVGSQHVSSEFNKQTLSVNIDEPVGFVEVFSEQWIRLLFFEVEQPINGSVEQQARADFSSGRSLDLNLSFRSNWPVLDVVYHDPTFESVESSELATPDTQAATVKPADISPSSAREARPSHSSRFIPRLARRLFDPRFWLRPAPVTAILAVILIAVFLFWKLHLPGPSMTAADLLNRSAIAEDTAAARPDTVLHRTVTLEVRNASDSNLIARNKVEVWQNSEKRLKASRLYDEKNDLIAGEWRRADGSRAFFNHGSKLQSASPSSAQTSLTFENAWQFIPSAKDFSALVGDATSILEEKPASYLITYKRGAIQEGLIQASLVVSRTDLHPIEETLLIKHGSEAREFHFIETSVERRATNSVPPAVFEPDAMLLSSAKPNAVNPTPDALAPAPGPQPPAPAVASADLEVEVLRELNQANALLGEQISLTRTPEGLLRVQGVVESDERKAELLRALGSFKNNPAIKIDVETVAEAVKREKRSLSSAADVTTVQVTKNALPVDAELRAYFSRRGLSGQQLDEQIRAFSERALRHSFEARRHALALKQIAERFSPEDLRSLDPGARAKWRAMIGEHARAFEQETVALRRELEAAFPNLASGGEAVAEISNDADLARAAARLFSLGVTNDEAVRRSFSLYAENPSAAPVKTQQFWHSLSTAQALAAKIAIAQ